MTTNRATGTFEVTLTPQPGGPGSAPVPSRTSLTKQFHGDLEASSAGQMLAANTAIKGSARSAGHYNDFQPALV